MPTGQAPEQNPGFITEVPEHLRAAAPAPAAETTAQPVIESVPGLPTPAAEVAAPTTETNPQREPIVVSRPGDPGHEQRVAEWETNQAMLATASQAAIKGAGAQER